MSLGVALNNAVSGLKLNQQALGVLSNNIANVNTVGYTRKTVEQSAVYVEGIGGGVRIDDIVRKVDVYLERSVISQSSTNAGAQVLTDYYSNIQVLLGAPGSQNSLDEYATTFFNAMTQMADQPERTSYRSNMVNAANTLASEVSSLAYELENLRYQADSDIATAVNQVNNALKELYNLNGAIARAHSLGQSTAGLLDARDQALRAVSSNLDITTTYSNNGTVVVSTGNGVALVDGQLHQLIYTPVTTPDAMINNLRLHPLQVATYNNNNEETGARATLIEGGQDGARTSTLASGKIQGLVELRDNLIPEVLTQLDMMASRLRDEMNALHNDGSGWPPAQSLTGTRQVTASELSNWTGTVRIAALTTGGQPVASPYLDETYTGFRPLTLDLSTLRSNGQQGEFSVQTLVDEINAHFGPPANKAQVGVLNNIELVSDSHSLPSGFPPVFNFDLELDNISGLDASLFVGGVTVRDDTGALVTNSLTQSGPSVALSTSSTYTTHAGESYVDVALISNSGVGPGDMIYLPPPSISDANGISAGALTGYFKVVSVSGNSVRIETGELPLTGGAVGDPLAASAKLEYARAAAGEKTRAYPTGGELQVDLSANITTSFYDITVDMAVLDENGNTSISQVTYRIQNNVQNNYNHRYATNNVAGQGELEIPQSTQPTLRAIMVDANGNELAKVEGKYIDAPGYLKIVGGTEDIVVAIDELDSAQVGKPTELGAGTYRGLSHYFGLNDFFAPNEVTLTGDTLKGSALNLKVAARILANPNLVSSGQMVLQTQPTAGTGQPQYTYVRYSGDNSAAQAMAALSSKAVSFDSAGGMPSTTISIQGYLSEMLGYVASTSADAESAAENSQLLYDAFNARAQATSGVNLDEELANTIIFQNSYAATARVVTVVNEMFKTLVDTL